jgi:hypothetical protein
MTPDIEVIWIDHQREPQCAPDPKYPHGIDIDISAGAKMRPLEGQERN